MEESYITPNDDVITLADILYGESCGNCAYSKTTDNFYLAEEVY